MAKHRAPIPPNTAANVLVANRHSCCVCQNPQVQLHHIDEDPSNNDPENLAVLCLTHHDLASMQIGLSKKLGAKEVRTFKAQWEARCAADVAALSRDRVRFYATLYKNPPRIRELFHSLSPAERKAAVSFLAKEIAEDIEHHKEDKGFQWQAIPGDNNLTPPLMRCLDAGELWPRVLPRVPGHPQDPDYPVDLGPPYGMAAFHGFDLYCQLMVRAICIARNPLTLEQVWALRHPSLIDSYAGRLVTFRERAIGKGITVPAAADDAPIGRVQFRVQKPKQVYRASMNIKNMYVFSDTAALNLRNSKVCGVALIEDAEVSRVKGKVEIKVGLKPLIIGMGGLGQSQDGWWLAEKGGEHDAL